jgi:6-phosphogluconolactonase
MDANGRPGAPTSVITQTGSGPIGDRQGSSHPHGAYFSNDGKTLYVPDLGADQVFIYRVVEPRQQLILKAKVALPPGSGPRHLALSSHGKFAYLINELSITVTVFSIHRTSGSLKRIQSLSSIPARANRTGVSGSEIFLHPSGKHLYVSNRGHDTIAVFSVNPTKGWIRLIQTIPVPAIPRGFGISGDGKWIVVAGQRDGRLRSFRVRNNGKLADSRKEIAMAGAVCVLFS